MSCIFKQYSGVYVIAEIGINHNGSLDEAKYLIEESARAGANGVKIQVRSLEDLYTEKVLNDSKTAEQGTQYLLDELLKAQLSYSEIEELFAYSKAFDIDFFATPFDDVSVKFLADQNVGLFKVGSPDFTNLLLIDRIVSCGKPIILSTGMTTEDEIQQVSEYLKKSQADFSLLHCNSTYPASPETTNLNFMPRLKDLTSSGKYGYSSHDQGFGLTMAAVAMGASIIERHITRDRFQSGPDHSSSLVPEDFARMVTDIRAIEVGMGMSSRILSQGEKANRVSLAKSLVAKCDIAVGTVLTKENITAKTPARGASPLDIDKYLGKTLQVDLKKDDYLSIECIESAEGYKDSNYQINRKWGIVGRLNDYQELLDIKPDLVEMHMTWRDLESYQSPVIDHTQDLVVHAPEYYRDKLIDFTSDDKNITEYSIEMLRKTIDVARDLDGSFMGQKDSRGPRVVVHPGGHFKSETNSDLNSQYKNLITNLKSINTDGVRILVENMPPYPWYFGGKWHNTVFMNANEIAQFASEIGWGVCYDTSHAQLYCNYAGVDLKDFTKTILNHVAYLHISDAKGVSEEGMQIGEGDVDFESIFALLEKLDVGFIPEIWQGHLNKGKGFKLALSKLEAILDKISGDSCAGKHHNH